MHTTTFRYFSLHIGILTNSLLIMLLFSKFHYIFFNKVSSFIKRDINLILWKSLLYALIFGKNMHKVLILFSIFVTNAIFKIFFTKRNFRYYYFINIYIVYWNKAFILVKVIFFKFSIINFIVFYRFLYMILHFIYIFFNYNFPLLLFTSVFYIHLQFFF